VKQNGVVRCVHVCDDVLHYSVEAQSRSSLLCCYDDVDRTRDAYSGTRDDGDIEEGRREMTMVVAAQ
jgi:hypothetical protein